MVWRKCFRPHNLIPTSFAKRLPEREREREKIKPTSSYPSFLLSKCPPILPHQLKGILAKGSEYLARAEAIEKILRVPDASIPRDPPPPYSLLSSDPPPTSSLSPTSLASHSRYRPALLKLRRARLDHEEGHYHSARQLFIECAQDFLALAEAAPDEKTRAYLRARAAEAIAAAERLHAARQQPLDTALGSLDVADPSASPLLSSEPVVASSTRTPTPSSLSTDPSGTSHHRSASSHGEYGAKLKGAVKRRSRPSVISQ